MLYRKASNHPSTSRTVTIQEARSTSMDRRSPEGDGPRGFITLSSGFDGLINQCFLDRNDAMLGCVENSILGSDGAKSSWDILERGAEEGCKQRSRVLNDVGRQSEVREPLEGPFESLVG
jgi:hypothetical protein